jgi:hypothetical protein
MMDNEHRSDAVDGRSEPEGRARFRRDVGIIVWCSFLAACLETMGFFAYFDPALLGLHSISDALGGYTAGFFFFWVFTFIAATLTAYLFETGPRRTDRS